MTLRWKVGHEAYYFFSRHFGSILFQFCFSEHVLSGWVTKDESEVGPTGNLYPYELGGFLSITMDFLSTTMNFLSTAGQGFPVGPTSDSSSVTHPLHIQKKKKLKTDTFQIAKKKNVICALLKYSLISYQFVLQKLIFLYVSLCRVVTANILNQIRNYFHSAC